MATDASFNIQSAFGVEGLIAVITGGGTGTSLRIAISAQLTFNPLGSGIGLMMAKALESNGATVYIVGRRLEALQKAASEHNVGHPFNIASSRTIATGRDYRINSA
jgi:hypothetical protein